MEKLLPAEKCELVAVKRGQWVYRAREECVGGNEGAQPGKVLGCPVGASGACVGVRLAFAGSAAARDRGSCAP